MAREHTIVASPAYNPMSTTYSVKFVSRMQRNRARTRRATTRVLSSATPPPSPLLYSDPRCFMYRSRYFYCVYVVFMPFSRVSPFRQRIVLPGKSIYRGFGEVKFQGLFLRPLTLVRWRVASAPEERLY